MLIHPAHQHLLPTAVKRLGLSNQFSRDPWDVMQKQPQGLTRQTDAWSPSTQVQIATTAITANPPTAAMNSRWLQQRLIIGVEARPCNVPKNRNVPAAMALIDASINGWASEAVLRAWPTKAPKGNIKTKIRNSLQAARLENVERPSSSPNAKLAEPL